MVRNSAHFKHPIRREKSGRHGGTLAFEAGAKESTNARGSRRSIHVAKEAGRRKPEEPRRRRRKARARPDSGRSLLGFFRHAVEQRRAVDCRHAVLSGVARRNHDGFRRGFAVSRFLRLLASDFGRPASPEGDASLDDEKEGTGEPGDIRDNLHRLHGGEDFRTSPLIPISIRLFARVPPGALANPEWSDPAPASSILDSRPVFSESP